MTKYMPKRIHFSHQGMVARTQLAALDHNYNVGREQSMTKRGEARYKSQFGRQKGDYVAKKIFEKKDYKYVELLLDDVVATATGELHPPIIAPAVHKSISRRDPPLKAEVVSSLKSRLGKK